MQSKKVVLIAVLGLVTTGVVFAKLPAPTDEQKEKAAAAKGKAADAAKQDAGALTKAQDRVTDLYIKAQKAKGVTVKPTPIAVAAAPASSSSAPAAKPAVPARAAPTKK